MSMAQFWFNFNNAWSGQKYYTEGAIQLFNLLYTSVPILLLGKHVPYSSVAIFLSPFLQLCFIQLKYSMWHLSSSPSSFLLSISFTLSLFLSLFHSHSFTLSLTLSLSLSLALSLFYSLSLSLTHFRYSSSSLFFLTSMKVCMIWMSHQLPCSAILSCIEHASITNFSWYVSAIALLMIFMS